MHRFLPALFQTFGHPLVCVPVNHRPRLAGQSKYTNFGRAVVGVADMLGIDLAAAAHAAAGARRRGMNPEE